MQLQGLGFGPPGLGAWTLEIAFDAKTLCVVTCAVQPPPAVCNPKRNDHTVRLAGAAATGVLGDANLATVVFKCRAAGTSALHVSAEVFADATIGGPVNITPAIKDGSITCT